MPPPPRQGPNTGGVGRRCLETVRGSPRPESTSFGRRPHPFGADARLQHARRAGLSCRSAHRQLQLASALGWIVQIKRKVPALVNCLAKLTPCVRVVREAKPPPGPLFLVTLWRLPPVQLKRTLVPTATVFSVGEKKLSPSLTVAFGAPSRPLPEPAPRRWLRSLRRRQSIVCASQPPRVRLLQQPRKPAVFQHLTAGLLWGSSWSGARRRRRPRSWLRSAGRARPRACGPAGASPACPEALSPIVFS